MALVDIRSGVPQLPAELEQLAIYLGRRDAGVPTILPADLAITTSTISTLELDVLSWSYPSTPDELKGQLLADAIAVYWANADTDDPDQGGVLIPASSMKYSMAWPNTVTRSYAIQPVRFTHRGILATASKIQTSSWRAVT